VVARDDTARHGAPGPSSPAGARRGSGGQWRTGGGGVAIDIVGSRPRARVQVIDIGSGAGWRCARSRGAGRGCAREAVAGDVACHMPPRRMPRRIFVRVLLAPAQRLWTGPDARGPCVWRVLVVAGYVGGS